MGIMLIGHGFSGLPLIWTSTGIGLRQFCFSLDALSALTDTYGLTPCFFIKAKKRRVDMAVFVVLSRHAGLVAMQSQTRFSLSATAAQSPAVESRSSLRQWCTASHRDKISRLDSP